MNELQKLYDTLVKEGLYTRTFEDFQRQYLRPDYQQKVFDTVSQYELYSSDFESFLTTYSPDGITVSPEPEAQQDKQPEAPERQILQGEEALIAANNLQHQDFWSENSNFGDSAQDYNLDSEGNYTSDNYSLRKKRLDAAGIAATDPGLRQQDNQGYFVWEADGLDPYEAAKLGSQLSLQTGQIDFASKEIVDVEEETDTFKSRQNNINREKASLAVDGYSVDDITYTTNNKTGVAYAIQKSVVDRDYEGGYEQLMFDITLGDKKGWESIEGVYLADENRKTENEEINRALEVQRKQQKLDQDQEQAKKDSAAAQLPTITLDQLSKKENWAKRAFNEGDLKRLGIEVLDLNDEFLAGELTFKSVKTGEEFKISTGGGVKQDDVDNLNAWLKENAFDYTSALEQSLELSRPTEEQDVELENKASDIAENGMSSFKAEEKDRQFIEQVESDAKVRLAIANMIKRYDEYALATEGVDALTQKEKQQLYREGLDAITGSDVALTLLNQGYDAYDEFENIDRSNPDLISEIYNDLYSYYKGTQIQKNLQENIRAKSSTWYSEEKFKEDLEEDAAERWETLDDTIKNKIGELQEIKGETENNGRQLNKAIEHLNNLRFDGLTFEEAVEKITSKEYKTKEELDAAEKELERIKGIYRTAYDNVQVYMDAAKVNLQVTRNIQNELEDLELEAEDLSWYMETIDDRNGLAFLAADALANAVVELGQGFIELGGIVGDVSIGVTSYLAGKVFGEETDEAIDDWYAETMFGDRRVQNWIDEFQQEGVMRYGFGALITGEFGESYDVRQTVSMSDIDSFSDFGEWALMTVAQQAPQLALMLATSGIGSVTTRGAVAAGKMTAARANQVAEILSLSTMGANAMGSKYKELREANELYIESGGLYGEEYNLAQMLLASGLSGAAEALSERITLKILKGTGSGITGSFSTAARRKFQSDLKDGFGTALRRSMFGDTAKSAFQTVRYQLGEIAEESITEGFAEIGNNLTDIFVLGKKDVGVFDGVPEAVATGSLIATSIKTPQVFAKVYAPFKSIDTQRTLANLDVREENVLAKIKKLANDPNADQALLEEARDELAAIHVEKAEAIELDIKRVDLLTNPEKKLLIKADKVQRKAKQDALDIQQDNNLTEAEKKQKLEELAKTFESQQKIKNEILERYPPNVVDKRYKSYMDSVKRRAADFTKRTGTEVVIKEGNTKQFEEYLDSDQIKNQEGIDEAIADKQAILDNENSTEQEKSDAQGDIDNLRNFAKQGSREYGAMLPIIEGGKLVRYEMFVNKQTSVTDGKFNTGSHEFMHILLHNTIRQNPVTRGILGQNLLDIAMSDKAKWKSEAAKNNFERTIASYDGTQRGEEILTNLSQAIQDGDVSLSADTFGGRIKDSIQRLIQRTGLGRDIRFDTADDVRRFVVNYSDSIKKNYTNRTLQRSAAKGITGRLKSKGPVQVSLAQSQAAIQEARQRTSFSRAIEDAIRSKPDLMQEFDQFVKNEDGTPKYDSLDSWRRSIDFSNALLKVVETPLLDGLVQQGMTELGLPPQALREFTRSAKENIQERLLTNFDPTKNDSLFGWLTGVSGGAGRSIIYRAKGDVMKAYKESGQAETTSLDAMLAEDSNVTFAETVSGTGADASIDIKEVEGATVFLESINASPELVTAINKEVQKAGVDIQGLTYKDVKKLVVGPNVPLKGIMDLVGNEFGISTKKINENKDLTSAERSSAQTFVNSFAQELIDMLPEGQTQSGQATGLPRALLNKFYVKGDRLTMKSGATAAGKFSQDKRQDISIEEFKAAFGINPDGSFINNKKFDGALRAIAVQAAMISANQTMRQQAIQNETNPLSVVATLGEGRGSLMFSKKGIGSLGKLLRSEIDQGILLGLSGQLSQNILSPITVIEQGGNVAAKEQYSKENIRGAIVATYGSFFNETQIDNLVNAIHAIAVSNKIPKTDKGKVTRQEAIQTEINKLVVDNDTKVKLYFGTNVDTVSLYNDPVKVKEHQGHAMAFMRQEVARIDEESANEAEAGFAIMKSMTMLKQQMSTAGKIGGKRAQLFTGRLFLEQVLENNPDLKFSIKETKQGVSIDFSKPITYKGQTVSITQADLSLDAQSGPAVLDQVVDDYVNGTNTVDERSKGVLEAREHLNRFVEFHVNLYNNGITGSEDLQMAAANLLSNMNPSLARAAQPKYIGEDLLPENWKQETKGMNAKQLRDYKRKLRQRNKGKLKPVYEHMQPRVNVVLGLFDAHLFGGGVSDVNVQFANYDVAIISDSMDKGLKEAKLNNSLAENQSLTDPSWMRYYNNATVATGKMVGLLGIGANTDVNVGQGHAAVSEIINRKQQAIKEAAVANKLLFSKSAREGRKGASIWDFDDTLATTKSNVIFNKEGQTKIVSAEDFAKQGADLVAEGWTPDFSEFNKVTGGQPGPMFDKALERAKKFGTKDTFILTARAPESQPAIKEFLDAIGLNIPLKNIVGLGNSTGAAKASWIAENIIAEGYNDIAFADDALQNVDAVQELLDQYDVKSNVQQAKLNFSRRGPVIFAEILEEGAADLDSTFNIILEETKGVGRNKRFSAAKARKRGKNKGKFKFFLPPSAEDLKGLIYPFLGKGRVGEKHHAWFKENIFDPFARGVRHLDMVTQAIANDVKELKKALPNVKSRLRANIPNSEFTYQDAIRVYNWNRMGVDIPGLSQADLTNLVNIVKGDADLMAYADGINAITQQSVQGDVKPGNDWTAGTIESDVADAMKDARKIYLTEFIENADIVFSEENLNKIEAVFGSNHREALEDMLYRMKTGSTRNFGSNRLMNSFTQWLNGSVGATMFFNARSAMLQMISNINFINWHDNNPLKAAAAFANQKQYWTDVSMIFNSPWLKQRRGGIGTDLNAAELLRELQGAKNPMKVAIAFMLKLGFTPTQIADSLAIATGGATMYRNRIKTYQDQGLSKQEAEAKAYEDMREIAEESQQSTREDKISQQQASPLGKIILAFQNVTMQYNRLMKRAAQDLVNGRGDIKSNMSKIIYYGMVQNLIFYGLQQGLFAALFGDDEEDQIDEDEKANLLNGMLDSLLRGAGIGGAVISTTKNVILEFIDQKEKLDDDKYYTDFEEGPIILEALNISPPIGIKARKLASALRTWHYNRDVINQIDKTDIDNPMYESLFNATEAVTNIPLHRLYNKFMNIRESMDSDHETWKRVAMFLGWSRWSFGIENQDVMTARDEVKEIKAAEAEERREQKKREREIEKAEEERQVIEDNKLDQDEKREEGATEVQCAAVSGSGKRCSNMALPGEDFCTVHMPVPQQQNEVQCSHIKKDGKRCKMKTKNKSGKCYYHD